MSNIVESVLDTILQEQGISKDDPIVPTIRNQIKSMMGKRV